MGHTQSDDIPGKPSASKFLQTVEDCFKSYDIVFADRNNHLTKHRVEIKERVQNLDKPKSQGKKSKNRQTSPPKITTADEEFPIQPAPIKILAIKWEVKSPSGIDSYQEEEAGERAEEMFRICNDRIRQRGTNHQNLHYGSEHERVLRTFIREAQPIDRLDGGDDDEVDDALTIEVKDEDTLEEDVKKVVNRLVELIKGLKRPSDEAIKAAVEAAKNYQAPKKAEEEMIKSFREFSPRYFSIDPDINLCDLIKKALASPQEEWDQDDLEEMRTFFKNLREEDRVTSNPHITIVHKSELGDEWCKAIWDMCMKLYKDINPPFFTFRLGALVEDGDIMALTVDDLDVAEGAENIEEAKALLAEFSKTFRKKLHITVGTRDESVKPFLAQAMVYSWNSGKSGSEVKALKLKDVVAVGRVRGSYV
ncbi:hypothetical protein FRC03_007764 [Tulasnella sp. 419]|nr:hypothetical protein FRC03_007764 [Tulasnella sp. 419]